MPHPSCQTSLGDCPAGGVRLGAQGCPPRPLPHLPLPVLHRFGGRTAREGQAGGGASVRGRCSPTPPPRGCCCSATPRMEGVGGGLALKFRPCRPLPLRPPPNTSTQEKEEERERQSAQSARKKKDANEESKRKSKRERRVEVKGVGRRGRGQAAGV